MEKELKPDSIYTTNETKEILKISDSTIKRLLKRGILKANKVGGQYRILGKEILKLVSPTMERKAVTIYQKIKKDIKNKIKKW